jgi:hypothetical protein
MLYCRQNGVTLWPCRIAFPTSRSSGIPDSPTSDDQRVRVLLQRAKSNNTNRAYLADWVDFTSWCATIGERSLPASPPTVLRYLTHLMGGPKKMATVARRVSTISRFHVIGRFENPVASGLCSRTAETHPFYGWPHDSQQGTNARKGCLCLGIESSGEPPRLP